MAKERTRVALASVSPTSPPDGHLWAYVYSLVLSAYPFAKVYYSTLLPTTTTTTATTTNANPTTTATTTTTSTATTTDHPSLVLSAYPVRAKVVAAPFLGFFSDLFGRRATLTFTFSVTAVCLALTGLGSGVRSFVACRLLTGVFANGGLLTACVCRVARPRPRAPSLYPHHQPPSQPLRNTQHTRIKTAGSRAGALSLAARARAGGEGQRDEGQKLKQRRPLSRSPPARSSPRSRALSPGTRPTSRAPTTQSARSSSLSSRPRGRWRA